jgi:hypothetical protein
MGALMLHQRLMAMFPDANTDPPNPDWRLQDDGDGNGPYIAVWNRPEPEPTHDEIMQWAPAVERRMVRKSVIVERLHAAGKLAAAKAALDADLYARERWYAPDRPSIYADDAEALALLTSIGADPAVILAP